MYLAAVAIVAVTLSAPSPGSVAAAESAKNHQQQETLQDLEQQHAQWKELENALADRVQQA